MDFYLIKISMYFLIALVYIFYDKLGKSKYKLLGGLYLSVFALSLIIYQKKKSKYSKDKKN